jgi:hypothetical protein
VTRRSFLFGGFMARLLIRQPLSSGPATLFASTIVFLRGELGVPSARIADAFGISLANVNTIRSRGNSELGDPGLDFLLHPEAPSGGHSFADRYGIRLPSKNEQPPTEAPNLDAIGEEFTRTVAAHKNSRDFLAGACALGTVLRPQRIRCLRATRSFACDPHVEPSPRKLWRFFTLAGDASLLHSRLERQPSQASSANCPDAS